jgi:hypothetical protein
MTATRRSRVARKVHAAVTEGSFPVTVMISAANIHEGTKLHIAPDGIHLDRRPDTGPERDRRPCTPIRNMLHPAEQILSTSTTRNTSARRYQTLHRRRRKGLGGRPRVFDKERDVQWSQVQRRKILWLAQSVQKNHNPVRKIANNLPWIRPARLHHDTPKASFQMSSMVQHPDACEWKEASTTNLPPGMPLARAEEVEQTDDHGAGVL